MRHHSHVALPTIIAAPGTYVTRSGDTVTITEVVRDRAYGQYANGVVESWDTSGRVLPLILSQNDVVGV